LFEGFFGIWENGEMSFCVFLFLLACIYPLIFWVFLFWQAFFLGLLAIFVPPCYKHTYTFFRIVHAFSFLFSHHKKRGACWGVCGWVFFLLYLKKLGGGEGMKQFVYGCGYMSV